MKEKIKEWASMIAPVWFTIGDVQMFCLKNEVVTGPEVEKCLLELANEGFLLYDAKKVKNPLQSGYLAGFKRAA